MIYFCGYCDDVIPKDEDIVSLIDCDYGILCRKHKKEIDQEGFIND